MAEADPEAGPRSSLKHYLTDLGGWFWVAAGSTAMSVVGLIVTDSPPWLLRTLMAVGLLVGPFVAYHRIRIRLLFALSECDRLRAAKAASIKIEAMEPPVMTYLGSGHDAEGNFNFYCEVRLRSVHVLNQSDARVASLQVEPILLDEPDGSYTLEDNKPFSVKPGLDESKALAWRIYVNRKAPESFQDTRPRLAIRVRDRLDQNCQPTIFDCPGEGRI